MATISNKLTYLEFYWHLKVNHIGVIFLVRLKYEFMILVADGFEECEMKGRMGLFREVLSMSDGGSEDTNGRSEPGIGFGFISNEWSVLVS